MAPNAQPGSNFARRIAWVVGGLVAALSVATLVLAYLDRSVIDDELPLVALPVAALAYGTVGAAITGLRHNRIGWVFCTIGLGFALYAFSWAYVIRGLLADPGSLPGTEYAAWLRSWVSTFAFAPIPLLLLLFPDGHLPSRRWRFVPWILVGVAGINAVGTALKTGPVYEDGAVHVQNPFGVAGFEGPWFFFILLLLVWFGAALSSVVAMVRRFRRAVGEERQQMKWPVAAASVAGTAVLPAVVFGAVGLWPATAFLLLVLFVSLFVGIPAASAIAILRYRLYDLDVVVKKTVVFGILAAIVSVLYVGIVVGVGSAVIGSEASPVSALTFLAAAVLALLIQPIRRRANHLANRLVYGKRATPYEVLSEFSDRMAGAYSTEEVLPRMAEILASGTGARAARVWLRVGDELRAAGTWPAEPGGNARALPVEREDLPEFPNREHAAAVRHGGELLGALTVAMPASEPLTPVGEKLILDLAAQAGLVLRNVRLIEELRASRQRIVTAQDARAKALERNIHDGAQQQLVALMVKLRLVETVTERDPAAARKLLLDLKDDTADALASLRDLARGIYPPLLADQGLVSALTSQARKSPLAVEVRGDGVGRYPPEVEAAIYFCCLEALQNAAKYAGEAAVVLTLHDGDGTIGFTVEDSGTGFDPASVPRGSGLRNIADRLEALGGELEIVSAPGRGASISGRIPALAIGHSSAVT